MPERAMVIPNADLKFAAEAAVSFLRNVNALRAIAATRPVKDQTIWQVIMNSLLHDAVLKWCKLFGSDHKRNQPLHWKNMFQAEAFREGLLLHLGCTREKWDEYATSVRKYRDELAAHADVSPATTHNPQFDMAITATFFYFEQLRPKLRAEGIRYADLVLADAQQIDQAAFGAQAKAAVAATPRWYQVYQE